LKELIALLKRVGLNEYESRVYASLLRLGEASASETSKEAGIPRARVYDVLLGLEKKGFVFVNPTRPIKFKAFQPETALSNFEENKRKEFEEHLQELNSIKEKISQTFTGIKKEPSSSEGVWLLKGKQSIYSAISECLSKTSESVLISSSELNALQKLNAFKQKIDSLNKKGVKFTVKAPSTSELRKFKGLIKVRASSLNSRFVVFDKKNVLLFLTNETEKEREEKALLIESPFIASYLSRL
jgi:sugar-specific transcriptional regulator TrmB